MTKAVTNAAGILTLAGFPLGGTLCPKKRHLRQFPNSSFVSGLVQALLHGKLGLLHILLDKSVSLREVQARLPGPQMPRASFACSRLAEAESLSPKRGKKRKTLGKQWLRQGFHSVPVSLAPVSSPLQPEPTHRFAVLVAGALPKKRSEALTTPVTEVFLALPLALALTAVSNLWTSSSCRQGPCTTALARQEGSPGQNRVLLFELLQLFLGHLLNLPGRRPREAAAPQLDCFLA